ncbi:zinc finger 40-like isoform X2 [Labeo rohita]|uniref:Zinc finger 40-like isoform X2 n=1 Tax=Labeo rohita TaxID=84645 RepID=A0A498LLD2_LABRO|nr:zinc finger 40-like isoform X2 [Labeo rohita]
MLIGGFRLIRVSYKIEEAQKELKDPKAAHKDINESTGRNSEGIKGLKRKKVVAQNQLKKIPKSPVKKQSQTKKSISSSISSSSKEATPSSSFSSSPSHGLPEPQDAEDAPQDASGSTAVKVEHKELSTLEPQALSHKSPAEEPCAAGPVQAEGWCGNGSNKNASPSHTSAPLEVLLKAMEPEFNTLKERKNSSPIGHLGKSVSIPVTYSDYAVTMPAVNFNVQSQSSFVPPFNAAKQFYSSVASTGQHTAQQYVNMSGNRQQDKPGFQKSYSVGPSLTLPHAPVPSGSGGFPQSQPPVVQTCQSLSATVPNSIQVPVTPGFNPVQMTTVVNFGASQTKSNLYKHKKSHAHAIKLGLVKDSGGGSLSQESDKGLATHSDVEESGESDEEGGFPQSQPPVVQTCQSLSATVPNSIQVPVTPGFNPVQMTTVVNFGASQTKSNLYKHKKSHAHAIKLGLVKDSGGGSLSQESDKGLATHSDVEESGESDEEGSAADLDPDSSQSSLTALSESSLQSAGMVPGNQGESEHSLVFETLKPLATQRGCEPKVTAALPKVVVHPVNVSPLRADSPRVSDLAPEHATAQRQRDFQTANIRSNVMVLSSLKEVDCTSPLQDSVSEDEDQHCKSPLGGSHGQLQRQQATDYSQQPQGKCLLSPRSLGSTDSGYFSRSESADQAMSPPSPFVKITPPAETDITKAPQVPPSPVVATVMHVAPVEKPRVPSGQMRPPLETKALSLEERISKLISDNEAVVDDKQLDSVKPRRTSLSRRGSIDSPKSYIFKDSFQFDLKPPESTASSKRMLSPANSLDIAMEKTQKRAKDEHGAACLTDGRSLNYLNSKMSEMTRQRKLMLVRQVCTTEPVDSPIETDAPEQLPETSEADKNTQTPVSQTTTEVSEQEMESRTPTTTPATCSSSRVQSYTMPENSTLKPQEKPEEQRWSPSKSPLRPPTFQGQVKLASSVSVVNTRDSHRLSFPSLKTATTFTWCFLMKRKPLHIQQSDQRTSAYSAWVVNPNNPNPLGLPTKVVMSLFDSKQTSKKIHYTQAKTTTLKSDILTYSGKLKDILPKVLIQQRSVPTENSGKTKPETQPINQTESDRDSSKSEPQRVKIFDGGYKSNEEYVYVRGRGRGKYICEECGIRCKKPSMLRKHIRTHSDIRPFHCTHCNFSFKTKGNLTKHMKSKAHSKKCMEMGVAVGIIEDQDTEDSGDRGRAGSADRQDSDGDDSDGPDDEDNDGEEEDEEDSQAESGLSATPSVSASPQHIPANQADMAPSSLLAKMSISPNRTPAPQTQPPQASDSQTSDTESVAMTSPVSLVRQMSISASCSSPGPSPTSFTSHPAPASESHTSDTDSVHMMSPVSPCRQMSIDYPDFDVPPSPPVPGKGGKLGQEGVSSAISQPASECNANVDRGTQTSSDPLQGPLHFPNADLIHEPRVEATTHLFSHLPLHSQQPPRSPYSMVPVGGIQLVPAGLAAYSTFVPIQAGPVQLTIPALSVIHRQTGSPLPAPNTSPRPEGSPTQPLVVQEPVSSVLPCFPLGQVAGLQTLGAPQTALQPVGLETLSVVGLANSTQLVPQQSLPLNATLGVQVLAASPAPQCSTASPAQIPGLQILNIALPALIPSLSPLSALSPLPAAQDKPRSPEGVASVPPPAQVAESPPAPISSASPPTANPGDVPTNAKPSTEPKQVSQNSPSAGSKDTGGAEKTTAMVDKPKTPPQPPSPSSPSSANERGCDVAHKATAGGASEVKPQQPDSRQPVTDDYNEASSDDEDRLVIAT